MKRAKLTQVPFAGASAGADLTDRLLGDSGGAKKKAAPPAAKAAAKPPASPKPIAKPKTARRMAAPRKQAAPGPAPATEAAPAARTAPDLPKYEPDRTREARPAATPGPALQPSAMAVLPDDTAPALRDALVETEKALAALVAAAEGLPARHDLAVRYRLDALRHHLKQVSDFLASRRP